MAEVFCSSRSLPNSAARFSIPNKLLGFGADSGWAVRLDGFVDVRIFLK